MKEQHIFTNIKIMATDRVELAKGGTSDDSIFVSSTFKDMFGEWFGYVDEKERTAKQSHFRRNGRGQSLQRKVLF